MDLWPNDRIILGFWIFLVSMIVWAFMAFAVTLTIIGKWAAWGRNRSAIWCIAYALIVFPTIWWTEAWASALWMQWAVRASPYAPMERLVAIGGAIGYVVWLGASYGLTRGALRWSERDATIATGVLGVLVPTVNRGPIVWFATSLTERIASLLGMA